MASVSLSKPPLARLFAVASVNEESGKPVILNALELQPGASAEFAHAGLGAFCFPEYANKWSPVARVSSLEAESYTFTLTGGDGSRTLGFCRRFLPPGANPRYPQVMCLLSAHPWFSLFSAVLKALEPYAFPLAESATLSQGSPIAAVLRALCAAGTPAPGAALPPPRVAGGPGLPLLRAPLDRGTGPANADVFFAPLLWRVPLPTALNLFAALLAERRVILMAADLSALSAAVHAAAAMLYPLTWQHIFLPVLPASLLDYLAAPMPFLVGLPAALAPAMRGLPMEEVVLLNLDTGVIECFAEDLALLPRTAGAALASELSDALHSRVHSDAAVAGALRSFFLSALGDYKRFVHPMPAGRQPSGAALSSLAASGGSSAALGSLAAPGLQPGGAPGALCVPADALRSGNLWFDHGAYVAGTRSASTAAFRSALRATQSFESYVTQRLDALAHPQGPAALALASDAFELALNAAANADGRLAKSAEAAKHAASAAAAAAAKRVGQAWSFAQRAGDRWAEGMERVIDPVLESAEKRVRSRSASADNLHGMALQPGSGPLSPAAPAGGVGHCGQGTPRGGSFSLFATPPPLKEHAPQHPLSQTAAAQRAAAPAQSSSAGVAAPASAQHAMRGSASSSAFASASASAALVRSESSTSVDFDSEATLSGSEATALMTRMAAHANVVLKRPSRDGVPGAGSSPPTAALLGSIDAAASPPPPPPPPPPMAPLPLPLVVLPPAHADLLGALGGAGGDASSDPFAGFEESFAPVRALTVGAAALGEQLGQLGMALPPTPVPSEKPDDWAELLSWAEHLPSQPRESLSLL